MASPPYSTNQDITSALRTIQGEVYYDTAQGVPWWSQILGHYPAASFIKATLVAVALTVPGVASAVCYLGALVNRRLTGQVQWSDGSGTSSVAGL